MKKREVTLVLSMMLALSVVGCGSNSEPKQEEAQVEEQEVVQEQEQEKTEVDAGTEQDITGQEFSNDDITIKVEDTTPKYGLKEFEIENASGTITASSDIPIYCENGYQIGYINSGATVEITGHGLSSAWYRFENPISGTPFDYIFVSMMDADVSGIVCDSGAAIVPQNEVDTTEQQAELSEEDKLIEEAKSLIDENKTYTVEEFHALMKEICNKLGTEYSEEVKEGFMGDPLKLTLNLNGNELKRIFDEQDLYYYILIGPTGSNPIDLYFVISDDANTSGDFEAKMCIRIRQ